MSRALSNSWTGSSLRGRAILRQQVARSLWIGCWAQTLLTLAAVAALRLLSPEPAPILWSALFSAALLAPAAAGGLISGVLAPHHRWWRLLPAGALGAVAFLCLTGGTHALLVLTEYFRWWLAFNLLADPVVGGIIGHGARGVHERTSLEPRPWVRS